MDSRCLASHDSRVLSKLEVAKMPLLASSCMSVHMQQLENCGTVFHEISSRWIVLTFVDFSVLAKIRLQHIEAPSCNYCCREKARNIAFWVCVCSFRCPACNAHAPYCHLWPAQLYTIFTHHLINGTIFEKSCWIQNACFNFLYNFCLKHFSFQDELSEMWSKMCICLHIKCPLFLSDFNETEFSRQFFEKYSDIKFYENPFSWSQVFPCGQTDGRTCRS